jgi:hypothetical protein
MTTKAEMVAIIKAENPTLQVGDDEQGYTQLSAADYEAQITQWAENRLAKETKTAADEAAAAQAATDKVALLAKLGITADEAKLLLS